MGKKRNCSIDILRLLFAILVVAIHTSPFIEYNALFSYFFSQTFSRLAVPFFTAVTGYFFFRNKTEEKYCKYLKKYFLLYSFWSFIVFFNEAIHLNDSLSSFVLYVLKTFFLTGWRQLWYLLAIIYIIVFLAFANMISSRSNGFIYFCSFLFLAYGIAFDNYGKVFSSIYLLSRINDFFHIPFVNWPSLLPFFMLGYTLNKPQSERSIKYALPLTLACIVGLLLEILFTTLYDLHENVELCLFTYPVIYYLLIWVLSNPYSNLRTVAKYCSGMATVIYFGHSVLQFYLTSNNITPTLVFLICTLIPAFIGCVLTKIDNPIINKFI